MAFGGAPRGDFPWRRLSKSCSIVATRTGRLPEIIEPGRNGLLVSADPVELARAIDRAIQDGPQMGRTCRKSVERFGWDEVGPSVLRQYEEALS